jgi:hypothetical protein
VKGFLTHPLDFYKKKSRVIVTMCGEISVGELGNFCPSVVNSVQPWRRLKGLSFCSLVHVIGRYLDEENSVCNGRP